MGHDPGRLPFLGIEHHVTRQVRAVPAPGHQVQGCARRWPGKSPRPVPNAPASPVAAPRPGSLLSKSGKNFDQPASSIPINELYHILERVRRPVGQQSPHQRRLPGRGLFFPGQDRGYGHRRLTVMRRQGHRLAIQSLAYPARWTVRGGRQMNSTSPVVRPGPAGPTVSPPWWSCGCAGIGSASPPACRASRRTISARRSPSRSAT